MTHRSFIKSRRAITEGRALYGTLRAISFFMTNTYGVLADDHEHLASVRKLEAKGLCRTTLVCGVVMVDLTNKGWMISGRQPVRCEQHPVAA